MTRSTSSRRRGHTSQRRSAGRAFAVGALTAVLLAVVVGVTPGPAAAAPPGGSTTSPTSTAPGAPTTSTGRPAATFGLGPSDGRRIDGRSGLAFLASPGSRLTDRVAIVNLAATPTTLRLYPVDAVAGSDGSIGYQPRSAKRVDAAAWITPQLPVGQQLVSLAPRQTRVVPLTITVPADASPGDHVAGVVASLTSKVRNRNGQLIDFDQRVAVRTSFRISGAVRAQLAIENLTADYSGTANPFGSGSATVEYTVHNTGNVTLGARQRVSVSGIVGEKTAPAVAAVPMLLPKASVRLRVTVPDVAPQFRLTGRVTLFPLVVRGETAPGLAPRFEATTSFLAVPWALLGLVALLVLLAVGVLVLRKVRRRSPRPGAARHRPRPALS